MRILIATLISAGLLIAGVVKVSFESGDLFITGSSKTTGNGSSYTVCVYFDAETGAFLEEKQFPGVGIDNPADLQAFCEAQAGQE
ncbi:MAG TPA: hypothetical protein PLA43_08535 [Bryobacteraceae bacterium]|nr:hypothetical protein [Bryobacteraceae bacterium]HOL71137.1 hypothetical protein [Bryobacteraceae bacterium]HOQ44779.1 hypothetical protein [Bryobacteraceae bacterium]HPQ14037.1 hypothetical protein [Bryobacteraceae bacterium]HPU71990.1 hypothetical protein [Bryobacteraceae bacterium]